MAVSSINNNIKLLSYFLGATIFALFIISFFVIPVPYFFHKIPEDTTKPTFDLTSALLLVLAIILFFPEYFIRSVQNIKISKVKISSVELHLDYLKDELKKNTSESDGLGNRDGLFQLLDETLNKIYEKVKAKVIEYHLIPENIPEEDIVFIKNNPDKCVSILYTHDYIRPEFLISYFTLQQIISQLLDDSKKVEDSVLIKAIGITMALLTKV
jgi:hypothetical protein